MYDKKSLIEKLAASLSDAAVFTSLAQGYHWNVLGSDFNEYHEFFGEIYEDVSESVDAYAENILKLGFEAPYLLSDFAAMSKIREERIMGGSSVQMLESLARANESLIYCLDELFVCADEMKEQGIADYVAGRIDMHKKWQWKIKSSLGIR
jgi:starvation-inducible DNA-binding protein